ncbi:MAG TPA: AraC family transcriptional regulator [Acidimicrobiales bacterium]
MTAEAGGRLRDDVLLEWYRYAPGPPVALPTHAHADYQVNLSFGAPGGVRYRGGHHVVPAGTLSVLMPDEPHTPVDPDARAEPCTHLTLYVAVDVARDAARQLTGRRGTPTVRDPVVEDADLARRFAALHRALADPASALDQDVRLLLWLTDLVGRHGSERRASWRPEGRLAGHRAVRRARQHLHDNLAANVSLAELAAVAGVSPFHLTRLFTAGLGLPPHAYQVQLRIERAKRLLLAGMPVSDAGHAVGFFDASHFTRHFKRHVGTAPGSYARAVAKGSRHLAAPVASGG